MAISISDLSFSYQVHEKPILRIPSWHIQTGEHLFLHGPSGCGKSTLLNLISGLLSPTKGELQVLDYQLHDIPARQRDRFRAKHIGQVFQQFNLIPYLNAIDNIALAQYFGDKKQKGARNSQDLLQQLGIEKNIWSLPARQLSIGQQQRVAIARALINTPQVLIADEPTSALDQHNRDGFMDLLTSLLKSYEVTLIFVSHDRSLAQFFDRQESLVQLNKAYTHSDQD